MRLQAVMTVLAARRYFLDGASKSEIAEELGISRFKVARLLEAARRSGIVRIEIGGPPEFDVELSSELAARHGLRDALVVRVVLEVIGRELANRPGLARPRARKVAMM